MSNSLQNPPPLKDRTKMKRKRKFVSSQDLEVKSNMTNKSPKQKCDRSMTTTTSDPTKETSPGTKLFPLTGWTLAISTAIHDPNNPLKDDHVNHKNPTANNQDNDTSKSTVVSPTYQELARIGRDLGAQISGQVHRRVSALICGSSCCETQRIRKARKLGIPILRAEWLYDCQQNGICRPWQDYVMNTSISSTTKMPLNLSTKSTIETQDDSLEQKHDIPTSCLTVVVNVDTITTEDQENLTNATGWTNAESLGCCCVCHETGINEDTCPWCMECRIHRASETKSKTL